MRERDRISLREFREAHAAQEAAIQAERLLHGRDPEIVNHVEDPTLTELEALVTGERETEWFLIYNPWFYEHPYNAKLLTDYVTRNGRSHSITRELLESAAKRMQRFGFLKERSVPQPPVIQTTPAPSPTEISTTVVTAQPNAETFAGWDIATGQPREFSRFEVDRMSGDEYARTFRLNRSGMLLAGKRLR
ncbi:hypothetical protein [Tunturiibacter gelidiferens]|uniref:hypothetical protein n=1 Tax=Tunturiibacter gelidiferens TaxID=3069689 RepID=UPI003D9B3C03